MNLTTSEMKTAYTQALADPVGDELIAGADQASMDGCIGIQ